ncbi:unnamed protein product [Musa hybrid cultivar]
MEVDLKAAVAFQAFVSFFVSALYEAQTQICHLAGGRWKLLKKSLSPSRPQGELLVIHE